MILLLLACKEPATQIVAGPDGRVTVELVNPTDPACTYCDPWSAVDTLRVDVYAGETLISSESFGYPDEQAVLPALTDFGVVRIEVAGLSAGKVESGGRTAEIALDPGVSVTVPMVFLPVNATLPLAGDMVSRRSRHVAIRRHDGSVALIGGLDAGRDAAFDSIEVYSPASRAFAIDAAVLPAALAAPAVATAPTGDVLLAGGVTVSGGVETPVATTGYYLPDASALAPGGDLPVARSGGCVALLSSTAAVALGGTATAQLDLGAMKGNTWTWSGVAPADLDPASVLGCLGLDTGSVFVMGSSAASTGLWSYPTDGTGDPTHAFTPVNSYTAGDIRHLSGAVMAPLDDGSVWIASGADPATDALTPDGRFFSPASLSFSLATGLQEARFQPSWDRWYRDGWFVVGCGWQDPDRVRDEPSLELVSPKSGEVGPDIPLDRSRSGCSVTSLLDGSILVAGGFTTATADDTAAAIVIPWLDEMPAPDTGG